MQNKILTYFFSVSCVPTYASLAENWNISLPGSHPKPTAYWKR